MRNKNFSSWAEEIDMDDFNEEALECNLSMGLLDDAREAITRKVKKRTKKMKVQKNRKECWQ